MLEQLSSPATKESSPNNTQPSLGSSIHKMKHHLGQLEEDTKNAEDKALDELRAMKITIASLTLQLQKSKSSEQKLRSDLAGSERRVRELETEIERAKESGTEMFDSLVTQMKKLEEAQLCIEEADSLRNELKSANAVEETTKKALDDLALALKEVAMEANQAKEDLTLTKAELEHSKGEEERLTMVIKSNDEKFRRISEELKRETEKHKNAAERLRLEAEETLLAWNDKEVGFLECLRKADEDRQVAQRLAGDAEGRNGKLRDILKQALSESRHAREAAEIARAESERLRDSLEAKEEALVIVAGENESLRRGLESLQNSDDRDAAIVAFSGADDVDLEEMEDLEGEKNSRKKRALMRRFGDLLIRKRNLRKKDFSD